MFFTAIKQETIRSNFLGINASGKSSKTVFHRFSERFKSSLTNKKKKYVVPSVNKAPVVEELVPITLYEHSNKAHVAGVRALAFLQGLFWINYGHLAYTKLGKQDEETGEFKLYDQWQRNLAFGVSIILGTVFGGGLLLYTKRCIFRATLLPKEKMIKLESDRWPMRDRIDLISSANLGTKTSTQEILSGSKTLPNNRFLLQSLDKEKIFILDSRGQFADPKLFDNLFHKPGVVA